MVFIIEDPLQTIRFTRIRTECVVQQLLRIVPGMWLADRIFLDGTYQRHICHFISGMVKLSHKGIANYIRVYIKSS